jgi:hypothetical protein
MLIHECLRCFHATLSLWPDLTFDPMYPIELCVSTVRDFTQRSDTTLCDYARSVRRLHAMFSVEQQLLQDKKKQFDHVPPPHLALRTTFDYTQRKFGVCAKVAQMIWRSVVGLGSIVQVSEANFDSHFVPFSRLDLTYVKFTN